MSGEKKLRRIWFKPDCVKWIREGIKTTTFRARKREGLFDVVKGSRFRAVPIGLKVKLTPIEEMDSFSVTQFHYRTEGDFYVPSEFERWLRRNKLVLPDWGWLHKVEALG